MITKRTSKTLSLFLAFCMVFTLLPTVAFAETGDVDSGVPLGVSSIITEFAALEDDIAEQNVDIGTVKDELKLLKELAVTVIEGGDTATGSDAAAETQTTVAVSDWTAEPEYNGETAGIYTFTPVLDLPESLTLAEGITAPTITVAVEQKAVTQMARGAVLMLSSSGNTIDLSDTNPLTSGTGWSYDGATQVYTIADSADVIITGSNAGSQRRVEVAADAVATITLDGASISGLGDNQSPLLLKSGAEVILAAVGDNTLSAGGNCAGIQAPAGTTLILCGEGSLSAKGGENGAGIGGGANGAGGSVRLSGWVTAIGGTNGVAIGGGSGSSNHGSLSFGSYTNFRYWTNTTNSDPGGTGTHNSTTAFQESSLGIFKFIRIEPQAPPSNIIDLSENYPSTSGTGWSYDSGTQVYTIANNADVIITGSNEFNQRCVEVAVSAKVAITLDGASISAHGYSLSPLLLKNGAEVTLILEGDNTLSAGDNCAGIQAPAGTTLILGGEGSLSAAGGANGAGIGGANSASGTITIGGTANVTAAGGSSGAGIGGAIGAGGTITIKGNATVTATGGDYGAGIGGANNSSCDADGAGGTIIISDNANVTATGGYGSAGIGGGQKSAGGNVRITGGTVKTRAKSSLTSAIGAGNGSYSHGSLSFDSYTDFRYWTNTTISDPGGDGTLHSVTPFPIASLKTFAYVKIAPGSAATVPSAPQSFTGTPGDGQVVLSWDAPASNGNAEILRYEVSSNNGVSWVTAAGDTSYTFTGLTNGTSYTFKVRAVNSAGNGIEASAITTPTAGGIPPTNAQAPNISEQPTGATYTQNDTAVELAVTASVVDGGTLSYQWYSNTTNSTVGGTEVGTNSYTYTPSTATVGTTYYYCVVTNTNNEATTNKAATVTSNIATIRVEAPSGGTVTVATPADLKGALEATAPSTITVTANIGITEKITLGASHTLVVTSGKTLSFTDSGNIALGSHTLTINGGGSLALGGTSTYSLNDSLSGTGTLNLANITVAVSELGINAGTLNINSGAAVTLNNGSRRNMITVGRDSACTVNSGGKIDIQDFFDVGINVYGGTLHINGGTVTVGPGQAGNSGIHLGTTVTTTKLQVTSGTLNGTTGGKICFQQDTKAEGVNGRFSDRGTVLTASEAVTVGEYTAASSATGLTSGHYYWNDGVFAKHMISISSKPQNMSVTEGAISGFLSVSGTASNGETVTYQWLKSDQDSILGTASIIPGATSNTFTIPTDLTEGSYYYYCNLRAAECGSMQSDIATVTVNAPGDTPTITITKHPQNVIVTQGKINEILMAEAVASNGKPVLYQWRQFIGGIGSDNTQLMLGETSNTLAIPKGLPAGTYRYLCVFNTDGTDYVDSNTAIVTVKPPSGSGDSGGSDNGGSGSGSYTPPPATTSQQVPLNQPVTATTSVVATAGANGAASASIPDKAVTDAIAKAQSDAASQNKTANGISVELNVTMPKGTASLIAILTRSSLDSLVSAGVSSLKINGSLVKVSFDKKALAEIQKQSSGNISIAIAPKTNLSDAAKKIIGTRPVYDITVGYGSGKTVSSFGGGVATVSIPYTLGKNEAVGGLYAVYVDAKGNATRIAGSAYDTNSGCVIFTTTHFSQYGIGYTAPTAKFTDISTHWAKEAIDYVVGRGLLSGTSETTFAPDTAMTRGMLVTALGRLAGVDTKVHTTNSFTDVNADSAYRPYIEWAYKNGIIQGIGNNQFAPDRAITREEIAVIIANFAKATGYTLPVTREATTYADASSIGSTYKTAVTAMQQAGIMMGGSDNKFNPKGNATRAEVSSMLNRYIKLTINPATAQGWAQGDDGQYMYYKDGKVLTGTQTIDGVKYVFNSNGVLQTEWVKDGDNWSFYSGKTMLIGWWDLGANGNNKTYYFTKDGLMVSGKWLEIDEKWYYFNADGSLAKNTKIDGYEVDENGVRKSK